MIRAIVSAWLCFLFWSPPVAAEERVDVALVLAADISYSIGPYELDLQRRGYIRAFRSTDVIKTITSGRRGRIAVSYLEWAGENSQTLVLPWTIIDGFETSYGVAEALTKAPLQRSGETSISGALDTARTLFATAPPADRLIIDLSADGYNNSGDLVAAARARNLWFGITINGLPIVNDDAPDLEAYFRDCVSGGPGHFNIAVSEFDHFAPTLKRKLIAEIAGLGPERVYRANDAPQADCEIGERKVREEYNRQLDDITGGKSERWRWSED